MKKIKICLPIVVFLLFFSIMMFQHNSKVVAEENSVKKIVAMFNNKPIENIKINNEKTNASSKIYELSDGDFLYNVDEKDQIRKVIKNNLFNVKIGAKISINDAKKIGEGFLKKTADQLDNYTIDIKEINLKNNAGYTIFFKGKTTKGFNTGSFAQVDLFLDGKLKGLVVHIEDSSIATSLSKISKGQAKVIIFNYLNTQTTLKKYLPYIQNNYTLESDVFHGVKIWQLSFKVPDLKYSNFQFSYLIDANTGDFLLKSEPKLDGFNADTVVEKRFNKLIKNNN